MSGIRYILTGQIFCTSLQSNARSPCSLPSTARRTFLLLDFSAILTPRRGRGSWYLSERAYAHVTPHRSREDVREITHSRRNGVMRPVTRYASKESVADVNTNNTPDIITNLFQNYSKLGGCSQKLFTLQFSHCCISPNAVLKCAILHSLTSLFLKWAIRCGQHWEL